MTNKARRRAPLTGIRPALFAFAMLLLMMCLLALPADAASVQMQQPTAEEEAANFFIEKAQVSMLALKDIYCRRSACYLYYVYVRAYYVSLIDR